jgi:hypothetical protein
LAVLLEAGCDFDRYTSLAMGVDGLGLISYREGGEGVLKAGHCEDAACTTATLSILDAPVDPQGNRIGVGSYSAIAMGRDGLGLISYEGAGLTVGHCEDIACTRARLSTIDERTINLYANSLAIGQDGLGLIAYGRDFDGSLLVAHCEDVACTTATVTTFAGALGTIRNGGTPSIAIGSDGLALIAYNVSDLGVLKVAHCQDTACKSATFSTIDDGPHVPHVSGYVGAYPDIAIGRDGLGLISYYDAPVGNLRVAHCADVPCTRADAVSIIDRGGPQGRVGTYTSVAIGGDGLGLVSFQGSLSSFQDQDLKVAHCQDVVCRSAIVTTLDRAGP